MCDCGLNGKWCNGHVCGCDHRSLAGRRRQAQVRVDRLKLRETAPVDLYPHSTWQQRFTRAFFECLEKQPLVAPTGSAIRVAQGRVWQWRGRTVSAHLNAQESKLRRELLAETGFEPLPGNRWYLPGRAD